MTNGVITDSGKIRMGIIKSLHPISHAPERVYCSWRNFEDWVWRQFMLNESNIKNIIENLNIDGIAAIMTATAANIWLPIRQAACILEK